MEVKVVACKESKFADKYNSGAMVVGYTTTVLVPGEGLAEVWCKQPHKEGDIIRLGLSIGKYHKLKVKVIE